MYSYDRLFQGLLMKWVYALITLVICLPTSADVKLPAIFGSHMVMQRDLALPVWGWADPRENVTVTFNGETKSTAADASGKWKVMLSPIAKGENLSMKVAGKNTIVFDDVVMGDVWLCSGQSNMGWNVSSSRDPETEIKSADFPKIRLFTVAQATSGTKLEDVKGQWVICSPETIGKFSAVGYFFGRDLHKNVGMPVGLINSSWGGTIAEAWTDLDALKKEPILNETIERHNKDIAAYPALKAEYQRMLQDYLALVGESIDPENTGEKSNWAKDNFDDSSWKTMPIPSAVEVMLGRDFDGVLWIRRNIDVPESLAGKDLTLQLGAIDGWDIVYFNGAKIGSTGPETANTPRIKRVYAIPGKFVRAGSNVVAARIFDTDGPGGVTGAAAELKLSTGADAGSIPLAGEWKYEVERQLTAPVQAGPKPPGEPRPHDVPASLYNAMIHPITTFAIKGAIWYQGESNASRAFQYRTLLPTMIQNWRAAWGQGEFPFLIVQLCNYSIDWANANASDPWAELREAQWLTAKNLPNCGMAVGIDVGEAKDIHPKDKQSIGLRLALIARKQVYGQDVVASGPAYKSMRVDGDKAILSFDNVHGGLRSSAAELGAFAVAGEDKVYHFANATIVGDTVHVSSEQVAKPVAVRYAWGSNPVATLRNAEGLPAIPFRTDDWPLSTLGNR